VNVAWHNQLLDYREVNEQYGVRIVQIKICEVLMLKRSDVNVAPHMRLSDYREVNEQYGVRIVQEKICEVLMLNTSDATVDVALIMDYADNKSHIVLRVRKMA
jgi:hypothetical protein